MGVYTDYTISELFGAVWGLRPEFAFPAAPSLRQIEEWVGIKNYKVNQDREAQAVADGFRLEEDKVARSEDEYRNNEGNVQNENAWGANEYFPIWMGGENLKEFDPKDGSVKWKWMDEFRIPIATLADFSSDKGIVSTNVSAGYGSVKELFTFGDVQIKLKGLLFDEGKSDRTLIAMRQKLIEFDKIADSIPVRGWLMEEFGISRMVIKKISFKQKERMPWVMGFDMDCDSDVATELELLNNSSYKRVD